MQNANAAKLTERMLRDFFIGFVGWVTANYWIGKLTHSRRITKRCAQQLCDSAALREPTLAICVNSRHVFLLISLSL